MIKLLLRLAQWLDSRFPAKVVVTDEMFQRLNYAIGKLEQRLIVESGISKEYQARTEKLEESISALKEAIVKAPLIAADNRRSEFIASGRMGE